MAPRRIVQTEDGWQVWRDNKLIAMVDENDTLRGYKHGEWITVGQIGNSNEILPALDAAGIR